MSLTDDIKENGLTSQVVQRISILEEFVRRHQSISHALTPLSGWIPFPSTWTRVSASTFTVTGNQTTVFQVGTKLRFDQTTTKYAAVRSASYSSGTDLTTVTIHVNTNYTLAAATISSPFFSYVEQPQGWAAVEWFDWVPSYSASGAMTYGTVTTSYAKFKVMGGAIAWHARATGTTGGVANTTIYMSPPTTITNLGANAVFVASVADTVIDVGRGNYDSTLNLFGFQKIGNVVWTLGAARQIVGDGTYQYT